MTHRVLREGQWQTSVGQLDMQSRQVQIAQGSWLYKASQSVSWQSVKQLEEQQAGISLHTTIPDRCFKGVLICREKTSDTHILRHKLWNTNIFLLFLHLMMKEFPPLACLLKSHKLKSTDDSFYDSIHPDSILCWSGWTRWLGKAAWLEPGL